MVNYTHVGSLVLIVPNSDGFVEGARGNDGLTDTHIHPSDLPLVEGVTEVVKCSRAVALRVEKERERERDYTQTYTWMVYTQTNTD